MQIREVGQVSSVCKNIARVSGFHSCINGQLVEFASGVRGLIMGFTEEDVLTIILGHEATVRIGDSVTSLAESFSIPVGDNFIGRVVNPLSEPCDGRGKIKASDNYPIMRDAPDMMDRVPAKDFLQTGTLIVDSFIPLAKGQRQLVIGDRMTGKTTVTLDTILNQKGKNMVCVYCCIGKSYSALKRVVTLLKTHNALEYTIIVAATAASPAGEQFLAPYAAAAMGEYFMRNGRDALVVFDDMTKHAWCYRQLSLLMGRPPGREAYPGDIFYIHSQLLERAGKFNKECKSGSMSFLIIVDMLHGDVTGFIPSNFISMTDGQIYLSSDLFREGFKPAVDLGFSVSRIGSSVQPSGVKERISTLRREHAQHREMLRLTKLKIGLSAEAERKMKRGEAISTLLKQHKNEPVSLENQMLCIYALSEGKLDEMSISQIEKFKSTAITAVERDVPHVLNDLRSGALSEKTKGDLDICLRSLS